MKPWLYNNNNNNNENRMTRFSLALLFLFYFQSCCILPSARAKQFDHYDGFGVRKETKKSMKKSKSMTMRMSSYSSGISNYNKKKKKKISNWDRYSPATGDKNANFQSAAKTKANRPPTTTVVDPPEPQCFQDADEATHLGTLVLDALWEEIKSAKHCRAEEISRVLDAYLRQDVIVQDQSDAVIVNGLDEYKRRTIGDANTPGGLVYACLYQTVTFAPTETARIEPRVFDDFAWIGHRLVEDTSRYDKDGVVFPEIYLMELLGAAGSFLYTGKGKTGKSSSSRDHPFFYSHHGKGKGSYDRRQHHCHRPQIYGIVVFDE